MVWMVLLSCARSVRAVASFVVLNAAVSSAVAVGDGVSGAVACNDVGYNVLLLVLVLCMDMLQMLLTCTIAVVTSAAACVASNAVAVRTVYSCTQ